MEPISVVLPAPPPDDHTQRVRNARAIFSTNRGKSVTLEAKAGESSVILRTDPTDDMVTLVANLRRQFPLECRNLTLPIVNIYDYFDHYDVHLHGSGMIVSVLNQIGTENLARIAQVERFCEDWKSANSQRFDSIAEETQEIFNTDENTLYNAELLQDAFMSLKKTRMIKLVAKHAKPQSIPDIPLVPTQASDEAPAPTPFDIQHAAATASTPAQRFPSDPMPTQDLTSMAILRPTSAGDAPLEEIAQGISEIKSRSEPEADKTRGPQLRVFQPHANPVVDVHSHSGLMGQAVQYSQQMITNQLPHLRTHDRSQRSPSHPVPNSALRWSQPPPSRLPIRPKPNFDNIEFRRPRGQSLAFGLQRIRSSLPIQSLGGHGIGTEMDASEPIPTSRALHANPHVLSMGLAEMQAHAQVICDFPGAMGPFPYQMVEPLQTPSPTTPRIPSGPQAPRRSSMEPFPPFVDIAVQEMSRQPDSPYNHQAYFSRGTGFQPSDQYQPDPRGLHLPRVRPGQGHNQAPNRGMYHQGSSQHWKPDDRDGSGHRQAQGQGGRYQNYNPRKTFSDDARLVPSQGMRSHQESMDENYGPNRSQGGDQRGIRGGRRYSSNRGSRQNSFSLQGAQNRDQFRYTRGPDLPMGYPRGVGDSGEYSGPSVWTIEEGKAHLGPNQTPGGKSSRSGQKVSGTSEADTPVKGKPDTPLQNVTNEGQKEGTQREASQAHSPIIASSSTHEQTQTGDFKPRSTSTSWQPDATNTHIPGPRQPHSDSYRYPNQPLFDPNRLYVHAFRIELEDVKRLFAGTGSVVEVQGPFTSGGWKSDQHSMGWKKGRFFFVCYHLPDDAQKAMSRLNNTRLPDGSILSVKQAFDKRGGTSNYSNVNNAKMHTSDSHGLDGQASRDLPSGPVFALPPHQAQTNIGKNSPRSQASSTEKSTSIAPQQLVNEQGSGHSNPKTPKHKKGKGQKSEPRTPTHHLSLEDVPNPVGEFDTAQITPVRERNNTGQRSGKTKEKSCKEALTKAEQETPTKQSSQRIADKRTEVRKSPEKRHNFSETRRASLADFIVQEDPSGKIGVSASQAQLPSDGSPKRKSRNSRAPWKPASSAKPTHDPAPREENGAVGKDFTPSTVPEEHSTTEEKAVASQRSTTDTNGQVGDIAPTPAPTSSPERSQTKEDLALEKTLDDYMTSKNDKIPQKKTEVEKIPDEKTQRKNSSAKKPKHETKRDSFGEIPSEHPKDVVESKGHEMLNQSERRDFQSEHGLGHESRRLQISIPQTQATIVPPLGSLEVSPPGGFVMTNPPSSSQTERSDDLAEERKILAQNSSAESREGSPLAESENVMQKAKSTFDEASMDMVMDTTRVKSKKAPTPRPAIPLRPVRTAKSTPSATETTMQQTVSIADMELAHQSPSSHKSSSEQISPVAERVSPKLSYSEAAKGRRSLAASKSCEESTKINHSFSENSSGDLQTKKSLDLSPTANLDTLRAGQSESKSPSSRNVNTKELEIEVPLRTPSPSSVPSIGTLPPLPSLSPQSRKDKTEIVKKDQVAALSPPIATHLKKKKGPTPTKFEFPKKVQTMDKSEAKPVAKADSGPYCDSEQYKSTTQDISLPRSYPAIDQTHASFSVLPSAQHSREVSTASDSQIDPAKVDPGDPSLKSVGSPTATSKSKKKAKKAKSKAKNRKASAKETTMAGSSAPSAETAVLPLLPPPDRFVLKSHGEGAFSPLIPLPPPKKDMKGQEKREKTIEQKANETRSMIRLIEMQQAAQKIRASGLDGSFMEVGEELARNTKVRENAEAQESIGLQEGGDEYYCGKGAYTRLFGPALVDMVDGNDSNHPKGTKNVQSGSGLGISGGSPSSFAEDLPAIPETSIESAHQSMRALNHISQKQLESGTETLDSLIAARARIGNQPDEETKMRSEENSHGQTASDTASKDVPMASEEYGSSSNIESSLKLDRHVDANGLHEKAPTKKSTEGKKTINEQPTGTDMDFRPKPTFKEKEKSLFESGLPDPRFLLNTSTSAKPKTEVAESDFSSAVAKATEKFATEHIQALDSILAEGVFMRGPRATEPTEISDTAKEAVAMRIKELRASLPPASSSEALSVPAMLPAVSELGSVDRTATMDAPEVKDVALPVSPASSVNATQAIPEPFPALKLLEDEDAAKALAAAELSQKNVLTHERSTSPESETARTSHHRTADSTSMSEYSTTSSTRRMLYSEVAAAGHDRKLGAKESNRKELAEESEGEISPRTKESGKDKEKEKVKGSKSEKAKGSKAEKVKGGKKKKKTSEKAKSAGEQAYDESDWLVPPGKRWASELDSM